MLDSDTKRRIDSLRDILVGKVPDPKSQVEQITIALIYKFMDDMDGEAEALGGKRSFFINGFEKFSWPKLLAANMGGQDTLNLYSEAIGQMTRNTHLPPLFRDIFKNAYLPYRDPETLRSFLKEIDVFRYDHSEKLGDAFEYLLSVLGSQGDAGQFRTPRHLIDFIVDIVNPQKHERMLDPACGTAGFLISAWKHILAQNSKDRPGDKLKPAERTKLAQNIVGFDISPDMVRLSLVNLYLHGFTDPHIAEYDSLTSQDRWNEYADVILANPPFMSPKGGIKPHNRFSVQSKRSEVLFVDYMAEHLTPQGRAAIIVPEGIIFQSQTAYTQLRKMLVEKYLVAVVSLPAGVFNPYSGVKTSILLLDKSLARQSDSIGFFKIENDGFGLGAQRREIARNDLPQARAEIAEYLRRLRARDSAAEFEPTLGLIVSKEKIAANGGYNLSGERYRAGTVSRSSFPSVELGEVCELVRGVVFSKEDEVSEGGVAVLRANNINKDRYELTLDDIKRVLPKADFSDEKRLRKDDIFICLASGSKDHVGKVALIKEDTDFYFGGFMGAIRVKPGRLHAGYLLKQLTTGHFNDFLREQIAGASINNLSGGLLYRFQIPLPPLDVQKQIAAEIEGYQRVINGARAVLANYRPHVSIHPDWPKRTLESLAENLDSRRVPITKGDRKEGSVPYYGASGIVDSVADFIFDEDILLISEDGANLLARSTPIAFSVSGKCWVNNHAHVLRFAEPATQKFVEVYLNSISIEEFVTGAAQPKVNQEALNRIPIPIPDDVATQQAIVAEIEAEQALVAANRELITRFEKKIQATLARVWGDDEPPLANDSASIRSEPPASDRSMPAVTELLPH